MSDHIIVQGPVVQSMVTSNPGLTFDRLFWFMHFCCTVCLETLKNKAILAEKIFVGKHVQLHRQSDEKFYLNI